jgi:asparaginyl-tRNA synthetase
MTEHTIADLLVGTLPIGAEVTLEGWVRTRRDSKAGLSFIHLSDGSSMAPFQVIATQDLPNYHEEIVHLTSGCAVRATGVLAESMGKGQSLELQASAVEVLGWVEDPERYPIQPKAHSMEYLREVAHLRPRTNLFGAVTRVRHSMAMAIHRFFDQNGFYWIHTPIITASDAEGAGEMFHVSTLDVANPPCTAEGEVDWGEDFFGRRTSLTVSGQLNVEAYCLAMSRVYTFGPTFRAEKSNTSRHLAEFWMVEPEIAFANLTDNADLAERFLRAIYKDVLEERAAEMEFFDARVQKGVTQRLQDFVDSSFERIEYGEAIAILERAKVKFEFPVHWGVDLQTEHERYLTEQHVGRPVVVMNYPTEIKSFYMRVNDDGRTVAAMDVLAPGIGEIIGGSQREERLDVLERRMADLGLDPEPYQWYLDLRRYGTVPHAGFGLGFERAIQYATGVGNIRDVIPFPRTPGSAEY